MPRRCVVPGCKSNYFSHPAKVSTFAFPKDFELKQKWINAINRKDWQPTRFSSVCSIHFEKSNVLSKYKYPKLVPDSVPSVFPQLPQYITVTECTVTEDLQYLTKIKSAIKKDPLALKKKKKKNPLSIRKKTIVATKNDSKSGNFIKANVSSIRKDPQTIRKTKIIATFDSKSEKEVDVIKNFKIFKVQFKEKVNYKNYLLYEQDDKVIFLLVDKSSDLECKISVRISINFNLNVKVFLDDSEVPYEQLKWILPTNLKLTLWSQLENLLEHYKVKPTFNFENRNYFLDRALIYLKKAENCEKDFLHCGKLDIIFNQVALLNLVKPL